MSVPMQSAVPQSGVPMKRKQKEQAQGQSNGTTEKVELIIRRRCRSFAGDTAAETEEDIGEHHQRNMCVSYFSIIKY